MNLRVIQWNIKINCEVDKISNLLQKYITENCIVNLQEVSKKSFEYLQQELNLESVFSLNLRLPGIYEGKNRKMGVSTFIKGGKIESFDLLNNTLFPERSLYAVLNFNNIKIHNLTFHSLTGVDYKKAKSSNFASIASFMAEQEIDLFTCCVFLRKLPPIPVDACHLI